MNEQDWYAQRIADEVKLFEKYARLTSGQAAAKAIAKALASARRQEKAQRRVHRLIERLFNG